MKKLLLIPGLIAALTFVSCKKDDPTPPAPTPTSNLSDYFSNKRDSKKQSFTINAGTYNQITGTNGVKIIIPANSFETASGALVTGNVQLSLIEILDQATMIMTGMPTVSGGNVLVSGGQLNLTATQGGAQVYLADNASINVMVPVSVPDLNMALFAGVEDSDGNVDWIPSVDDSSSVPDSVYVVQDSTGGAWGNYYYFNWSDSTLGWINCDYFYGTTSPLTNISVTPDDQFDYTNTAVFIHFSDINSILQAYDDGTAFVALNIPEGEAITVVCISEISGQYYSAFVPVTITNGLVVPVTMNTTTLTDIENAINNL